MRIDERTGQPLPPTPATDADKAEAKEPPATSSGAAAKSSVDPASPGTDPVAAPDTQALSRSASGARPPVLDRGAKVSLARPPRSVQVPLTRDPYDSFPNSQLLLGYADVVDGAVASLEKSLPGAEPAYLKRIGLLGLEYLAINWGRLASHEGGHVHAAREAGLDAHIEYLKFTEGLTMLEGAATPEQRLRFFQGGLNQSETTLTYLHRESARTGELTLSQGLLGLSAAFDDTGYILRTWQQDANGDPWQYADPASIQNEFRTFGKEVTYRHMLGKALVADLLSSATWESLGAAVDYVRDGSRVQKRHTFSIGDARVMGPDVALLRSVYGDTFRVMTTVNPGSDKAWDVRLDVRTDPDDWDVNAVGARLQRLDLVRLDSLGVSLSPFVGFTQRVGADAPSNALGPTPEVRSVTELGFDFDAKVNDRISIFGTVSYGKAYDGALQPGMQAWTGVKLRF